MNKQSKEPFGNMMQDMMKMMGEGPMGSMMKMMSERCRTACCCRAPVDVQQAEVTTPKRTEKKGRKSKKP